jgi:hypothetical protein
MHIKLYILLLSTLLLGSSFKTNKPKKKPTATKKEQNGYYKTYADFTQNKIELMDAAINCDFIAGRLFVVFRKGGNAIKVPCKDIWGFKFKNQLFRNFHEKHTDYPCAVVSTGKITYYEMGSRHIDALIHNIKAEDGTQDWGHACYFSKTLGSDMMSVSNTEEYERFKQAYTSTDAKLFNCLNIRPGKVLYYKDCVVKYNKPTAAPTKKKTVTKKKKIASK